MAEQRGRARARAAVALLAAALAGASAAQTIPDPAGTTRTAEVTDPSGLYTVAVGPAGPDTPPPTAQIEAPRRRIAWRAEADEGAALRLLRDLRAQLTAQGFAVVFTCGGRECGGFDFRRHRPVLPMPDMVVDLAGYTYLAARRGPDGAAEALASVLVSQGPAGAHAQLTLLAPQSDAGRQTLPAPRPPQADPAPPTRAPGGDWTAADVQTAFAQRGALVLEGVTFATGGAAMGDAPPARLAALADWLRADPARRVALVGHTDWTGPADVNRRLARQRAAAVADMLTGRLGIAADRVAVAGAGPYAPRAGNTTQAGRTANRRVEAVALPPAP